MSLVAVSPGIDWTMRKIATAARVTRIIDPANSAVPENQRSPGRCLTLTAGAVVVVMASCSRCRFSVVPGPVPRDTRAGKPSDYSVTIRSIAALTCSVSDSEIGALPAASAAACWPSGLATYCRKPLTTAADAGSVYSSHAIM